MHVLILLQENGVLIESMDACFGLARKKRQGQSFRVPKHADLFFADQDDVYNFVDGYSRHADDVQEVIMLLQLLAWNGHIA